MVKECLERTGGRLLENIQTARFFSVCNCGMENMCNSSNVISSSSFRRLPLTLSSLREIVWVYKCMLSVCAVLVAYLWGKRGDWEKSIEMRFRLRAWAVSNSINNRRHVPCFQHKWIWIVEALSPQHSTGCNPGLVLALFFLSGLSMVQKHQ